VSATAPEKQAPSPGDFPDKLQLKRILVPTDFSRSAEHALKYAVQLGKPFKASIFVLHVFHLREYLDLLSEKDQVDSGTASQVLEAAKSRASKKLEELVSRSRVEEVTVLPTLLIGVPFEEIVRYAAEQEMDLIVMPTHARTHVAHLLLGSTTERVISHSFCPVLVVRMRPGGR
jgi:nucleotide-binding universal stress UspA family protein